MIGIVISGIVGLIFVVYAIKNAGSEKQKPLGPDVPQSVKRWRPEIKTAAKKYGIPWELLLAQLWVESGGDPNAIGNAGEIGLMQLKDIAILDLKNNGYGDFNGWQVSPRINIMAGAAYLDLQRKRTGNLFDALGQKKAGALEAYNEGYATAIKDVGPDEYSNRVLDKKAMIQNLD